MKKSMKTWFVTLASVLLLLGAGCSNDSAEDSAYLERPNTKPQQLVEPERQDTVNVGATILVPPELETDNLTVDQRRAMTLCMEGNGKGYIALSELSGEKEVFCSFGTEGECTQRELLAGECLLIP